jgi:xanthine dehydrogenase iron-sulfur cluster and FAD-binding subunit A
MMKEEAAMWRTYLRPTRLDEALELLDHYGDQARIIAGGTDVLVELSRDIKPTETLIDITALSELRYLRQEGDHIALGALATHNDVMVSTIIAEQALPLAQACSEVGAPQIRTRATVAGNLITASPANDTITPLMALDASVVVVSREGERTIPLERFYEGVRRTVLRPNELLREIRFPAMRANQRGLFLKLGLRRAQAISVINAAFVVTFADDAEDAEDAEDNDDTVVDARITLGSVATTIIHARAAEGFLRGRRLNVATCAEAGRLVSADARPIGDVRGSADYRVATLESLVSDGLRQLGAKTPLERNTVWSVLLDVGASQAQAAHASPFEGFIEVAINGAPYALREAGGKTLLNALREDAGLTGTKEGCAEGECGACTVWLNGQAVMSCLVPAEQAHGGEIVTIEGLARAGARHEGNLHPLQAAFIEKGAVQCGYCIPGMLMAGGMLLREHPQPDLAQAQTALSGNICRCTGYTKILEAVMSAGKSAGQEGSQQP